MINLGSVLNNLGFDNGRYSVSSPANNQIDLMTSFTYGNVEGEAGIDTLEEFITAAYYSPVQIEYNNELAAELPRNSVDGALRLTSMWLKKAAENRLSA